METMHTYVSAALWRHCEYHISRNKYNQRQFLKDSINIPLEAPQSD